MIVPTADGDSIFSDAMSAVCERHLVPLGAFAEARRVLGGEGLFVVSVWDRIEENEFADVVTTAVASQFPDDRPASLARTERAKAGSPDIIAVTR